MQGNTPSLQQTLFFKKQRVDRFEPDESYLGSISSPFLLEVSGKKRTLFFASKSDLYVLPSEQLEDFLMSKSQSLDKYDIFFNEPNKDIIMMKLSPCEDYLAVMFQSCICVIYLPDLLKPESLQTKCCKIKDENAKFRHLEWPPITNFSLSNPHLLTLNSNNVLRLRYITGPNNAVTNYIMKFYCATFSVNGRDIFAFDSDNTLHILDATSLSLKKSIKISALSESLQLLTSIVQLEPDILVAGSVKRSLLQSSGDQEPKILLLKGSLTDSNCNVLVRAYPMPKYTSSHLESQCVFKFSYIQETNLLLYTHSNTNAVYKLHLQPDRSFLAFSPSEFGENCIRGFGLLRTKIGQLENSEFSIQNMSASAPVLSKLLIMNTKGMLYMFMFKDAESFNTQSLLINSTTYQTLVQSRRQSTSEEGVKDPQKLEAKQNPIVKVSGETKPSLFSQNKKSKMMEDDEDDGKSLTTEKKSAQTPAAINENKSKKRNRGSKNSQEEEVKLERPIERHSSVFNLQNNFRAHFDPANRLPGREYYKIKGFRNIAPDEDGSQNPRQVQSQDTINIPKKEDAQLGLNEMFQEQEIDTQNKSILTISDAIRNVKAAQENTSSLSIKDLLNASVLRLEAKKDIFHPSTDHYSKLIEDLKLTSNETEELIKDTQEDLQKYERYLDENKQDLLKDTFKANALMEGTIASLVDELADEKDISIAIDLEDEHRIELEKTAKECARQMNFVKERLEALQNFKRNQERLMTSLPNHKPRMIEYHGMDRKKMIRSRKEEYLKTKRGDQGRLCEISEERKEENLSNFLEMRILDANAATKHEREDDKMFQAQELFKLVVNENTLVLQEMKTRIEILRKKQNHQAQEGSIMYQFPVDEQNPSNLIDPQWNKKDKLFEEILSVFSEKRAAEEPKENNAFNLKTKKDTIISNVCYKMKMPIEF